jgi:N6-L-threonylcarbamoyladenine synthase
MIDPMNPAYSPEGRSPAPGSRILGIETSCDETGIAMVEEGRRIVANVVASQAAIHAAFGGVVPEIASRHHTECIVQLTRQVLNESGGRADAVAATHGPGLMGSLLVGINFAKALAYAWNVPYIPVQHIEGHLFSVFLADDPPEWPFLALVVSGGHTMLVWCAGPHRYEMLGSTRDDAVGESFDKVARLLGLPYPGGPSIQKAAENGKPDAIGFPRSMAGEDSLEFSFSGLKTAVLYHLRDMGWASGAPPPDDVANVAASFQAAAIDILLIKTKQALARTQAPRLIVAGGVAANRLLRQRLLDELDIPVSLPPMSLCVDNGAMIAAAAHSRWRHNQLGDWAGTANPALPLPGLTRGGGAPN